jgi:hypothetical protein
MRPVLENCTLSLYHPDLKGRWDDFIGVAKNGNFLFFRDYMDYHSDRFVDHSLMFYLNRSLIGCVPATRIGRTLHSHRGLTYGGLVMHPDIRLNAVLAITKRLADHLRDSDLDGLVYNPMPHIYHRLPAEEDLEAFAKLGGQIVNSKAISVLRAGDHRDLFSNNRRRDVDRFRKLGLALGRSNDFGAFMTLCALHLSQRFSAKPLHTVAEIRALANRFPNNIQLYAVHNHSQMIAGVILYCNALCAKIQYLAHDDLGKEACAATAILAYIIDNILPPNTWLELGHSVGLAGEFNEGVFAYKESLGARTVEIRSYLLSPTLP